MTALSLKRLVDVPSPPMVWAGVARELVGAVERAGVERRRYLQAVGLRAEDLDETLGRLSRSQLCTMQERALELTGDPAFGLHWAEWLSPTSFDLVSHLLVHAATLRQALDTLLQYGRLLADQLPLELTLSGSGNAVMLRNEGWREDPLPVQRLAAEMMTLGMFRLIRLYAPQAKVERVTFAYPAPAYASEYQRLFEAATWFDQPFTGIAFDRALLDVTSPRRDDDLHSTLQGLAERRLWHITQHVPYAMRVRAILQQESAPHRAPMSVVARSLGLSVRSLHRRLADEGMSFSQLSSEAAASVAKSYLATGQHTIQETAFAMGFTEASSFARAFKRWVGAPPSHFYRPR